MSRSSVNNQGFTLLETVIAMMIFFSILYVVPLLYDAIHPPQSERGEQRQELLVLFQQLQKESLYSVSYDIPNPYRLEMTDVEGTVRIIQMQNNQLIMRVNNQGHTILLNALERFEVKRGNRGVVITITLQNERHSLALSDVIIEKGEWLSVKREL
ncbi:competence type IV pilus minor pilin ComGF [Geomicrobium sediminis]|uniref:Competence protein ComGF n=1 Tax=Geomicrobium sediminis TaxID=1347788 RepID=A0ABS2PEJ5_9BACL|nr:competence type IV pilus minor pilin ComGF [Geomicrobium sediminis]MBM7633687.1 competence protein ComGF [Geomicrobium sediminis]